MLAERAVQLEREGYGDAMKGKVQLKALVKIPSTAVIQKWL